MTLESLKQFNISLTGNAGKRLLVFDAVTSHPGITLIDYQQEMLFQNPQGYIIPAEIRKLDNVASIAFNISDLVPVSDLLKNKIGFDIIWNTFYELVTNMVDSRKLLLYERNFVLDEEFIYIDAANKIKLLYLPIATKEGQFNKDLESFILRFLSKVTHIIPEGDEYFKKVTALIKNNDLSLDTLNGVFRNVQFYDAKENCNLSIEPHSAKQSSNIENLTDNKKNAFSSHTLAVFLLSQAVVAGISLVAERFLYKAGFALVDRYIPIVVFILCVDYTIYKLFLQKRSSEVKEIMQDENCLGTLTHPDKVKECFIKGKSNFQEFVIEDKSYALSNNQSGISSDNNAEPQIQEPFSKQDANIFSDETTFLGSESNAKAWLIHDNGGKILKTELKEESFLIGRSVDLADMLIPAKSVGRIHARIITRDNDFYLIDEDSRNGTFVNNIKIDPKREYQLKNDDIITFANIEYKFIK